MKHLLSIAAVSGLTFLYSCTGKREHPRRLNDIRIIGSHNSYKIAIEPALWQIIYREDSNRAKALQYEHIPISEQLDLGLRNLELDILHDPMGGRYTQPAGLELVRQTGADPLPYDPDGELEMPGLKVFHIPDIDFRSHQLLFAEALREINDWSDRHTDHIPIIITLNAKDSGVDREGFTLPLPFSTSALDSIDLEIRQVIPQEKLITPDLVRGDAQTLETAVRSDGWPLLEEIKGRFLFVLDEKGNKQQHYIQGHPSLKGRVMFVNADPGTPEAAFLIMNDPVKDSGKIKNLVKQGYMIRTRADAGTTEAREINYDRFRAALESGAQVITTDYYIPSKLFRSTYKVEFEEGGFAIQ